MKEKIKKILQYKSFHISIIISIIVILLLILLVVVLRYNEQGETNMPFELSKIAIISSSQGIDKENANNKWDFLVSQNNDVYIYIQKNNNYSKTEVIDSVVLNNFTFEKQNPIGDVGLYKPDLNDENQIFRTIDDNKIEEIEYVGDVDSNIKSLKMANQGDMIAFRVANCNIGEYISNEEEVINHTELLKKLNLTNEDLNIRTTFNITIKLKSGKEFSTKIELNLPVGNIIEDGTTSYEITDTSKFIFKRIKN